MEKIKNYSVMRFVAFAVAIAIILGLSSAMLSFTASAEDVVLSDLPVGTIGNYKALRVSLSSDVCYIPLSEIVAQSGKSSNVAIVGKCNSGYKVFCIFSIVADSNNCTLNGNHFLNDGLYRGSSADINNFALQMWCSQSNGYRNLFYQLAYKSDVADTYSVYVGWNGTLSDKFTFTDYYFIFGSYSNDSSAFVNDIENSISSDTEFKDFSDSTSPTAEFLSFKGTESSGLYLVDWVQAGQQYPIVDFRIDDKGNHHKYALRISGNSNYAEILKGIWDRQEVKEGISAAANGVGVLLLLKAATSLGVKAVATIAGAPTPIGALFLNKPISNMSGYVLLAAQNKLAQEYDTLTYDNIRTLSSDSMNFSEDSTTVSKSVSLCLSDYVSVIPNTLYKLEIIDVTESKLLDVAYFSSRRGYTQSDSGYGTVVSDYDNQNDLDNDVNNNNGYSNGNKNNGDKLNSDNPYDIIKNDNNDFYSKLDISNIFNVLQSSATSIGAFFQACLNIVPSAILSILLSTLSLLIVLRVLGR